MASRLLQRGFSHCSSQVVGDSSCACQHLGIIGLVSLEDSVLFVVGLDCLSVEGRFEGRLLHDLKYLYDKIYIIKINISH